MSGKKTKVKHTHMLLKLFLDITYYYYDLEKSVLRNYLLESFWEKYVFISDSFFLF